MLGKMDLNPAVTAP